MTKIYSRESSSPGTAIHGALSAVTTAEGWVVAAKRTRSAGLLASAEMDLQAAVDGARDVGAEWGQIGSTLGIARGNAYQRYRKRLSHNEFSVDRSIVDDDFLAPR